MWVPLLGLWGVISYDPILVCRQYASEQFTVVTYELSQLEFAYGYPGYALQLIELSTLWGEPQWIEFARHSYDVALGYLEWKSIRVKDAVLPTKDDFIQPADPLLEKMPMKSRNQN